MSDARATGGDPDWSGFRARYPAVETCTYLNTAAGAPLSRAARRAGSGYYRSALEDGDVHWDEWLERVEGVRRAAAGLIGAAPDELAFTTNASVGLNLVARMLAGRGSVLAPRGDFPSLTLPWLQMGYDVRFAEPGPDGAVGIEALEAVRSPGAAILAISHVHYRGGARADLAELGAYCRQHDLVLVVDATQSLGAMPVDVGEDVDFLAFSGYKWLTAGYGVGGLFVARRHLDPGSFPAVGWRSARDPHALVSDSLDLSDAAAALELGHPPFAGVFSLGAALEVLGEPGVEAIARRIHALTTRLATGLRRRGIEVVSEVGPRRGSGILLVRHREPSGLVAALAERGVLVSHRGDGVRISVHAYNDEEDLARLLDALDELR